MSCTIITTKPNDVVAADIHDRMPVILRHEDEGIWLDREKFDSDLLQSLLVPYDHEQMKAYPVPAMVGSPKNDTPECIQEIANPSLF
ncbi:SOS response-associated peptidase family protein [Brevibacillus sp. DP1.3A]|uniref:SOS response-associated peptidase family protein n=1 Tax=Brevibacillus sp. DP1.3A TaxID=2738867 RepID=UPI00210669F8|nr:SOS response-associated peptidase family protein [Brevibacillus sp. DP1.3A]